MIEIVKGIWNKLDFKTIIIIGLLLALLLVRMCSSPNPPGPIVHIAGKPYEVIKHTIDTVVVNKTTTLYKPGKIIYVHGDPITPPINVDKDSIVKEFYTKNTYKDTLKLNDNLGTIYITDTVFKNKIQGRTFKADVIEKLVNTTTIVKELPKNQLYIGGVAGFDKVDIVNYIGPGLLLKTKSDKIYSVGIGIGTDKQVSIQGGLYWKIKLGK
jgi:hypothetical protein